MDPSHPADTLFNNNKKQHQGKGIWNNQDYTHHPQPPPPQIMPTQDIIIHQRHHDPQNSAAAVAFENVIGEVIRKMPDSTHEQRSRRPPAAPIDYNNSTNSRVLMHNKVNHPSFDQRKSAATHAKQQSIVTPKL